MRHEAAAQAGASTREAVLAELGRSLIDELEDVIARKDVRSRAAVMRRVSDLFMMNGAGFSQEHVSMFDEVMSRLIAAIDGLARVTFGDQFARMPHAPPRTLRMLALDDAIEVAGPVLTRSQGISDDTLVETANTKSQAHLHAIAQRPTISAPVTDVLVDRGDQQVVRATAANPGARFPSAVARSWRCARGTMASWRARCWPVATSRGSTCSACSRPPRRRCGASCARPIRARPSSTATWCRKQPARSRPRCGRTRPNMRGAGRGAVSTAGGRAH